MLDLNLYREKKEFQKARLFVHITFQNNGEMKLVAWKTSFFLLAASEVVFHSLSSISDLFSLTLLSWSTFCHIQYCFCIVWIHPTGLFSFSVWFNSMKYVLLHWKYLYWYKHLYWYIVDQRAKFIQNPFWFLSFTWNHILYLYKICLHCFPYSCHVLTFSLRFFFVCFFPPRLVCFWVTLISWQK